MHYQFIPTNPFFYSRHGSDSESLVYHWCVSLLRRSSSVAYLSPKGTSSGFGKRLVASVLNRGDRVIATARSLENIQFLRSLPGANPSTLHLMQLDIAASVEVVQEVVDSAFAHWGRIDVLVNNAGYGLKATIEEGGCVTYLWLSSFFPNC